MNEELRKALETGKYLCPECGNEMVFEDEKWKDSLMCEACGYGCNLDEYGLEYSEIEGRRLSEIVGQRSTETYEEIYGEDDD